MTTLLVKPETISIGDTFISARRRNKCTVAEYDYTGGRVIFLIHGSGTKRSLPIKEFCLAWRRVETQETPIRAEFTVPDQPPHETVELMANQQCDGVLPHPDDPPAQAGQLVVEPLPERTTRLEREYVAQVMNQLPEGQQKYKKAARLLGISVATLYRKLNP